MIKLAQLELSGGTPVGGRGSEPGILVSAWRPLRRVQTVAGSGLGHLSPPLVEGWALGCPVLLPGLSAEPLPDPAAPPCFCWGTDALAGLRVPRGAQGRPHSPSRGAECGEHRHSASPQHHSPEDWKPRGPDATAGVSCPSSRVEPSGHSCSDRNGRRSLIIHGGRGVREPEER